MKKIFGLLLGGVLFLSCYDEGKLNPSPEPELIYGKYTLPQGNHDYDNDIVKFYRQYSSLILYKFTSKDFGWSPTYNESWNVAEDTIYNPNPQFSTKLNAVPADEKYVGEQLKLLNDKLLCYLSDTLLHLLPQRILLCSVIEEVPVGLGYDPKPEERTPVKNLFSGYYHIAITWGSDKILTMTAEERNQFKIELCTAYFETILSSLETPQDFFLVTAYADNISASDIYANGLLDHNNRTSMGKDWFDYIKLAIGNSVEELEAEGGVLNESIDVNGKIREKYTIMTNFFKSKYQFDIQAIGNDVEH